MSEMVCFNQTINLFPTEVKAQQTLRQLFALKNTTKDVSAHERKSLVTRGVTFDAAYKRAATKNDQILPSFARI